MASAKEERVSTFIERRAGTTANPVSELVTNNGAENSRDKKPTKRDHVLARKNAGRDEQGIAGQEKSNEQAGLDEKNCTSDCAKEIWTYPQNELF